jgi:predicted TIM-barrel fold metal-dependent hydrolase
MTESSSCNRHVEHACSHGLADRRRVLAGLAAAGAGALLAGRGAFGQAAGAKPHRIDIHHHLVPPKFADAIASRRSGGRPPKWTPEMSLEEMDKSGIATSITSLVQPSVWLGDVAQGRALARDCNEYAAGLGRDHPGRFGVFAALPLPDAEGSLKEIEYALDVLKADGFGLMTSYGDKWLGHPSFWPVMEELNRRKAVVYTHPLVPDCCRNLAQDVPPQTLEFTFDTTRTIASLLFSGTSAKFPDIRFIHSHGGGATPFVLSRFQRLEADMKERGQRLPKGALHELAKFHYDTAQANHPGALAALMQIVPVSQVLFGTDYPFRPGAETVDGLRQYFKADELRAIERENAMRLMPRLKA